MRPGDNSVARHDGWVPPDSPFTAFSRTPRWRSGCIYLPRGKTSSGRRPPCNGRRGSPEALAQRTPFHRPARELAAARVAVRRVRHVS